MPRPIAPAKKRAASAAANQTPDRRAMAKRQAKQHPRATPGQAAVPASSQRALVIEQYPDESDDSATARKVLRPTVGAAVLVDAFKIPGMPVLSLAELVKELDKQCKAASENDLTRCEAMLTAQAHTLDAIANRMALAAFNQFDKSIVAVEVCMKLALRAQSQCRATVETLAAIKNPPVVYAKQANIAHGHQQINNGVSPASSAQAPASENAPNELLGVANG